MIPYEEKHLSAPYREAYRDGIRSVLDARRREANHLRQAYISPDRLAGNQEVYRQDLADLLGWPLTEARTGIPRAVICEEKRYDEHTIMRRLQIEALPGLPFYGLLFLPDHAQNLPLVIAQHGGGGTPELAADLHGSNNYRHMIARVLERNCVVFAPQLLLWREEEDDLPNHPGYGTKAGRAELECSLRQVGSSIAALEIYCLMRALDYLSTLPQINPAQIGMIGLSYGGFYTQMLASLDLRIRSAVSNAFFNDRYAYCWNDFSWCGSAERMLDAEVCALIAPRALCIHIGREDKVFDYRTALPEIDRLREYYAAQSCSEQLKIILSDVNHTLTEDGEEIDFLFKHLI